MSANLRNWVFLKPGEDGHYPLGAWFLMVAPTGDKGRTYGYVFPSTMTSKQGMFGYYRFSPNSTNKDYVKTLEEAQKLVEAYADKYPQKICSDCNGVGYLTEPSPKFEGCKACDRKGTFYLDEKYN